MSTNNASKTGGDEDWGGLLVFSAMVTPGFALAYLIVFHEFGLSFTGTVVSTFVASFATFLLLFHGLKYDYNRARED